MARIPPNPVCVLRGHSSAISSLDYDEDNNCLVSGTQNGTIIIWNTATRSITSHKEYSNSGGILQIRFLSTNSFFTHCREGIIRVIDIDKGFSEPILSVSCASLSFLKATVAHDSRNTILFVPGKDDSIDFVDLREGKSNHLLPKQLSKGMVMACEGHINSYCLGAFESGHIARIDSRNNSIIEETRISSEPLIAFTTNEEFTTYACGGISNKITIGNCSSLAENSCISLPTSGILSLAIRCDSRLLASGGKDGKIRLFGLRNNQPLAILSNHTKEVNTIMFSKRKSIVSGSSDMNIMLWDIYKNGNR
ncbi:hypothetical protein WA171_007180, partial [Blastocystis sp. BT1]